MAVDPPVLRETLGRSLGREDPLERERQRTPVFLPGESHGQRSLVGYGSGVEKRQTGPSESTAHSIQTMQEGTDTEGLKGISQVAQWLRILPASARNTGPIPGPEARVPLAEGQPSPAPRLRSLCALEPRAAHTRNGAASTTAQPKIRKGLWDSFRFPDAWVVGVSDRKSVV